ERRPPDEVAADPPDEAAKTRLVGCLEHRHVDAEIAVALLHPEHIERAVAERLEAVRPAGRPERVPDPDGILGGHRQLPAELAGVADPRRIDPRAADGDLPRLSQRDGLVG